MTPGVRVIRFARVETGHPSATSGSVPVSRVLLDEQPAPVGEIVVCGQTWSYLLSDGSSSGLTSTQSRQDLERQVTLYHLGTLAAAVQPDGTASPLKLAV